MGRAQQTKKEKEVRLLSPNSSLLLKMVDGPWGAQIDPCPFLFLRTSPSLYPQLDFQHINHLSHFEINRSGYYSNFVNDTINQGIN